MKDDLIGLVGQYQTFGVFRRKSLPRPRFFRMALLVRKAQTPITLLLISDLGWSAEEAQETRARLATLEEDWEAPGMEAYDCL